jgi:hypothetical protein
MDQEVIVYGVADSGALYNFRLDLTSKGIVIKESINSLSNTVSIFTPKKSKIRDKDTYIFSDFESKFIKRGDVIEYNIRYLQPQTIDVNQAFNRDGKKIKDVPVLGPGIHGRGRKGFYFVNEIIINQEDVELKCVDMSYFLMTTPIDSDFNLKDTTITELSKKIVEKVNITIKKYNDRFNLIDIIEPLSIINLVGDKNRFKIPYMSFEETKNINFILSFTPNKRDSVIDILKILEKNYLLNSQIVLSRHKTIPISTYDRLYKWEYYTLRVGVQWGINKIEQENYNKTYFSDIPQSLIATVKNRENEYLKIIKRDDLIYQKKEDVRIKVVAKIIGRDGKFKEIVSEKSDLGGEVRTYTFYDKTNKSDIAPFQAILDNELDKLKYDGFKTGSSFETFGYPQISPNSLVVFDGVGGLRPNRNHKDDLKNSDYFLEKKTYMVESVETTFNANGYRQKVGITFEIPNITNDSIVTHIYKDYTYQTQEDKDKEANEITEDYNNNLLKVLRKFTESEHKYIRRQQK